MPMSAGLRPSIARNISNEKSPLACETEIKTNPVLAGVALIRQSRLSVMPLGPEEYAEIVRMAKR